MRADRGSGCPPSPRQWHTADKAVGLVCEKNVGGEKLGTAVLRVDVCL
jgi:hypothetical protein